MYKHILFICIFLVHYTLPMQRADIHKQTINTEILLKNIKFIVCHPTTSKILYIAVLNNGQDIKAKCYLDGTSKNSYKATLIKEDGSKDIDLEDPEIMYNELRKRFIQQNNERK